MHVWILNPSLWIGALIAASALWAVTARMSRLPDEDVIFARRSKVCLSLALVLVAVFHAKTLPAPLCAVLICAVWCWKSFLASLHESGEPREADPKTEPASDESIFRLPATLQAVLIKCAGAFIGIGLVQIFVERYIDAGTDTAAFFAFLALFAFAVMAISVHAIRSRKPKESEAPASIGLIN